MKVLWLDTETSGLDKDINGIIEIGMIIEIDEEVVEEHNFKMNPVGREISEKSLEISGTSLEDLEDYPYWGDIFIKIKGILKKYVNPFDNTDKFILAGHNVQFDSDFMDSFFKEFEDKYWYSYVKWKHYIDTLPVYPFLEWANTVPQVQSKTLTSLCETFSIPLHDAHTALADIRATRELALEFKELIRQ